MKSTAIQFTLLASLMLVAFLITARVLPELQLRPGNYPQNSRVPAYQEPGDGKFWITSGQQELSHIMLFHDIGESISNARQADILLFGNSRLQTGLRESVIVEQARKLGLKVFTIATGHADKTRFALKLIRKYDLHPRVVVASGGPFVFTEGLSPWAQEVVAMSRWSAIKKQWELTAAWAVQSNLHHYLPRVDFFDQPLIRGGVKFRSENTGWWQIELEPNGHYPVSLKAERKNYNNTLKLGRELKRELDDRGALLVLTMVPYMGTRSGHLPFLSEELNTPFVLPSFSGMETSDGSHLNRESAQRYSRAFWEEFIQLQAVRKQLAID